MATLREPLRVLGIVAIALTSGRVPLYAQGPASCDQTLARQIALTGLNQQYEHSYPLSSP